MFIKTLTKNDFIYEFMGTSRKNQFSREALGLIFESFSDYDEPVELDIVAICCDYTEDTPEAIAENYGIELNEDDDEQTRNDIIREYLVDNTYYVGDTTHGTFVYQNF